MNESPPNFVLRRMFEISKKVIKSLYDSEKESFMKIDDNLESQYETNLVLKYILDKKVNFKMNNNEVFMKFIRKCLKFRNVLSHQRSIEDLDFKKYFNVFKKGIIEIISQSDFISPKYVDEIAKYEEKYLIYVS